MLALQSELRPAVAIHRIDDPDGHARMLEQLAPYWPAPDPKTGRGPYFRRSDEEGGARHQWARVIGGKWQPTDLFVQCPCCGSKFVVACVGQEEWECQCPTCAQDACGAEDGGMPPCGCGSSAESAAQEWSELSV